MRKIRFISVWMYLFFGLISCTPSTVVIPQITADKLIVKVGETMTITVTAPTAYVTGQNANVVYKDSGFIYSIPTPPITLPDGSIQGPYSGNPVDDPKFLINTAIEVVSPSGFDVTLPPRIPTIREGDMSKVTFGIKGKSVGTVVLRAGFLTEPTANPYPTGCGCGRTPLVARFDGEIIIQVVP